MNLFKRLFNQKKEKAKEKEVNLQDRGKYMPNANLPLDESFMINFKANGGKFLYCETIDEVYDNLGYIIQENNWSKEAAFIFEPKLKELFTASRVKLATSLSQSKYFICSCENLIANDGSLLISSNQIAEKKLPDFPLNFIVYATTSQIVTNISEGLRAIKAKNKSRIPSNITTIKHFKDNEDKDFLSYGSSSKDLYLLLLEDL